MTTPIRLRIAAASLILLAFGGLHAYSAIKGFEGVPAVIFVAANLIGALALVARRFWARWFALGIGTVGLVNCLTVAGVVSGSQPLIAAQGVAFASLMLLVLGRSMAEAFEGQTGWPLDSWRMRLVSWAAVLNIGAVAMLIRGLGSQWEPTCVQSASVAGIVLGTVGILLVWQRRTAGLLLLAIGAFNALMIASHAGQWAMHLWHWTVEGSNDYICGTTYLNLVHRLVDNATIATALVPAAASALIALVAFSAPMVTYLRDR